jgi:hypothetical protein
MRGGENEQPNIRTFEQPNIRTAELRSGDPAPSRYAELCRDKSAFAWGLRGGADHHVDANLLFVR